MKFRLSAIAALCCASVAQAEVFINEIHYDDAGADANEFIEIAGPAGTDLSGASIVLYNGNGGAAYGNEALSGIIPDQQNGFGTLAFPISGIQNGSPDGIALVDSANTLVQFLSYEGSFTAVGGVADGVTSTDIGVMEPGNTPEGESLQLSGTGTTAADFTWQAPAVNTSGAINTGQTFGAAVDTPPQVTSIQPADGATGVALDANILVVFNEAVVATAWNQVQCDNSGGHTVTPSDDGMSFTLDPDTDFEANETCTFTISATDITDLDGAADNLVADVTVSFSTAASGSTQSVVITEIMQNPSAVSDSNGEWFELLNTGDMAVNLNGWTIRDNDSDSVVVDTDLVVPPGGFVVLGNNANVNTNGGVQVDFQYTGMFLSNSSDELVLLDTLNGEVDRVEWDNGATFPDPNGASMMLIDPALDNNVGSNWQAATLPFGDGDLGTPGSLAGKVELIISEIMQNPAAVNDSNGEWFEIHNASPFEVNLKDWTIQDNDSDSFVVDTDLPVPAGGFVVLGNNADMDSNGGAPVDYQYTGMFLSNGSDELVLISPENEEADRVEWDNGASFPDPSGASMELIGLDLDNSQGINWTSASQVFGDGDRGTPGVGPDNNGGGDLGQCFDSDTESLQLISAVQGNGSASPLVGQSVIIEAVVTGQRFGNNGILEGFFVQEEIADEDNDASTSEGIFVFSDAAVTIGNVVRVGGEVTEFFDLTELTNVTATLDCAATADVSTISVDLPLPAGVELEHFEGMRVSISDLVVTSTTDMWRRGEIALSNTLKKQPTDLYAPLTPEYQAQVEANNQNILFVEDNNGETFPDRLSFFPGFSYANAIRIGDTISAAGPLHYAFGNYRVNPSDGLNVNSSREFSPDVAPGNLTVATFNVLNYFNGLPTGNGVTFDYPANRGAENATEFALQQARIVEAIVTMDADVVGLMEIENDGFDQQSAIQSLIDAVNAQQAADKAYSFISTADQSLVGTDAIAVGLIYRPSVVTPKEDAIKIAMPEQLQQDDTSLQRMRTSLLQSFTHDETGQAFAVVVNHFKSKGSGCYEDAVNTTALDSIQGSCNAFRVSAAVTLGEALKNADLPERVMILGDLNAYSQEDPLAVLTDYDPAKRGYTIKTALRTGLDNGESVEVTDTYGFTNVAELHDADGFSYWFFRNGLVGSLDHVLANDAALQDIVGATHWNINAFEAFQLQYDQALSFYPEPDYQFTDIGPFRSSDHDPFIVSFDLQPAQLPGDFDNDGDVDNDDFRGLISALSQGLAIDPSFDLNNDGVINVFDLLELRKLCTRRACSTRG